MDIQEQIQKYIDAQPEVKRRDMQALHSNMLQLMPACKLWFLDGKDSENKTVSNPNIGYGSQSIKYAAGKTREFYQIGISANKTGISVYILGITDKNHLAQTYGNKIGKASVSGYCIKFKTLNDINMDILEAAIRYGVEQEL
jgi:DNA replication protein DnaC